MEINNTPKATALVTATLDNLRKQELDRAEQTKQLYADYQRIGNMNPNDPRIPQIALKFQEMTGWPPFPVVQQLQDVDHSKDLQVNPSRYPTTSTQAVGSVGKASTDLKA